MKGLLYVGNRLSVHGNTATAIEVLGPMLEQEGFRVAYASSKKNKFSRLADMIRQTVSRRKTTDYVLIDTYSTWNFWYALLVSQLCRMLGLKYIPILHGGNLPNRLKGNPRLCRMIFGHSTINVAPSGYLHAAFTDAGFSVVQIPNPFDAEDFPHLERQSLMPRMLWVRSFADLYNPAMALSVLSVVKEKYPQASLCMVGPDKGLLGQVRQKAQSENLDVTFTGRLSKKEWAELSKSFDIFINTARTDNAPFSIIEALSLGMAVVSTNVGGIPHLLQDRRNALLVNNGDAQAMAKAVVEPVENENLRKEILAESRQFAAQSDWNNVKEKWLKILV